MSFSRPCHPRIRSRSAVPTCSSCFESMRRSAGRSACGTPSRVDNKPEGDPPVGNDPDERLDQSKRFASYGRWVEANTRAALVDENLTDAAKWAWLKAECEIPGETWYWLHKVNGAESNGGWYDRYLNNDPGRVGLGLHDRLNGHLQFPDRCRSAGRLRTLARHHRRIG